MGLRETKKQRARATIIENAVALFRERGFEATRVRDIAEAAEISEATFFNYFSAKDAVLSAWAHELVADCLVESEGSSARGARPALRTTCARLAERVEADRHFAHGAWERARLEAGVSPSAAADLMSAGQAAGQLRRDLSARQLGEILYASLFAAVGSWLARGAPPQSLQSELRRVADLVLDGARRRNERVRPAVPAGISTR